ncbi:MAG: choice-of-anchor J domain-containing protein [Ginsengibacter sp.]
MKKILLITFGLFAFVFNTYSQKQKGERQFYQGKPIVRCATDQRVKMLFKVFPEKKLEAERLSQLPPSTSLRKAKRLQSVVYLPVVFHIVLQNPYVISDAVVQSQIDALNRDFSGLNSDTTNLPAAFEAVRGHSSIRFVLARRTPSGDLTNGIDRVFSTTTGNPDKVVDSIKRASLGGADAWDPNNYINVWVGNVSGGGGVLGYTQIPGSGSLQDDGIFCNILGFGESGCNAAGYNKGRTVVHEMGHYFGLNHIWGDDENSSNTCSGDDFRALTADGSTYSLPSNLYNPPGQGNTSQDIGDTPDQSVATTDCPSGIRTDSCTPNPPGIMYEDFMDYTLDDCYAMFTKKQVERMEYVLTNYRGGLITSQAGSVPSNAITVDASPVESINPGGFETSGCSSIYYPATLSCPGNFIPKVLIKNNGLNTITSITVGYTLNNGTPVTVTLNPNLATGATKMITFAATNVVTGNNNFQFFTKNVNGAGTDNVPANDTLKANLFVPQPASLPISEGFESSIFPPPGWTIVNPGNDVTWQRVTPGYNSSYSMFIDNYGNNTPGEVDEIRTPKINLATSDPVVITFDLAHKNYTEAGYNDSLQVLVSTDCGATFKTYFNKAGAALATAGSSSSAYTNPVNSDWKNQKIVISNVSGSIIVVFRNVSDYGNNIFIDNINIKQETSRDISVVAVNPPAPTECTNPVTPIATIKNVGISTITGFNVSYSIDKGTPQQTTVSGISLLPDSTVKVPLNSFTPTEGAHQITVFSSSPQSSSGTGDLSPLNDTLNKSFFVVGKVNLPVTEGFESSTFPAAGWSVENPDGDVTWQRTTKAAKTGAASMYINNYKSLFTGTTDKFVSSVITGTATYDSIYVSFDYAYNAGNSSSLSDTLELQVTTDCGQTFKTVWEKSGTDLQTVTGYSPDFVPLSNAWKNISLNLFDVVGKNDFQVYFVFKGNKQNNVYIDNINLYGITVPARLKQQGYLIYPNPFHQQFIIRNYEVPVTLQSAHIYNSLGQLVWTKEYNGKAYTLMNVDFSGPPPGVYILKLQYTDKTVVQKIVKQ